VIIIIYTIETAIDYQPIRKENYFIYLYINDLTHYLCFQK